MSKRKTEESNDYNASLPGPSCSTNPDSPSQSTNSPSPSKVRDSEEPNIGMKLQKEAEQEGIVCMLKYTKKLLSGNADLKQYAKYFRGDDCLVFENKTPDSIRHIINIIMTSPARGMLAQLFMEGTGKIFSDKHWFKMMDPTLSQLRELNVTNSDINNADFSDICATLPLLEELHMSGTKVTNLTGVSKLEDLRTLILADCQIESSEAMSDVFNLNELRHLDISGLVEEEMKNMEYFCNCDKALPQLTHLDCSQNEGNDAMVEKVVLAHPTMLSIGIYDVALEKATLLKCTKPVKIFNIQSLESCTMAIDFYARTYSLHGSRVCKIMEDAVETILRPHFQDQSQRDLHRFLLTILQLTKRPSDETLDKALAYSFLWMIRDNFTLTRGEIQCVSKWVPTILHYEWSVEGPQDPHWEIHFFAWHILTVGRIFECCEGLQKIADRAIELMEKMDLLVELFPRTAMVLALALSYMDDRGSVNNRAKTRLQNNRNVQLKLLHVIATSEKTECVTTGIALVTRNYMKNADREYKILFINTILDYFAKTFSPNNLLILFVDQKILEKYEIVEFLKKNRLNMFLDCLNRTEDDLRPTVILLLARIFHSIKNEKFDTSTPNGDRTLQKTAHDIMKIYFKMHKYNDKDKLGAFKRIKACKKKAPDEVIAWATWFMGFFDDGATAKAGETSKKK